MSPPIAFIFEWNSTPSTPSPRSTRLAPAFRRTTALRSFAVRRICRSGAGRRHRLVADAGRASAEASALERVADERRRVADAARLEHLLDADRVPRLERPELPAEAPLHRAVDVVDGVRDVGRDARGVDERRAQRVAQERADLVLAAEQRP